MTLRNKTQGEREAKNKGGRPVLEVDWDLAERMAAIHCTDAEIAAVVGISLETFKRRKLDPEIADRLERARANGKASLRRIQWKLAESGNAALAIWLGKNLLGQREPERFDAAGEDAQPLPWKD